MVHQCCHRHCHQVEFGHLMMGPRTGFSGDEAALRQITLLKTSCSVMCFINKGFCLSSLSLSELPYSVAQ